MGDRFVAAVLTGGASRRMGRDKATLPISGVPMAVRVADAARAAGAERTVAVGRAVAGLDVLADDHPGEGPLGGLITGLRWAGGAPVVVLGCDLLEPRPEAIRRAVEELAAGPRAVVAVPVVGGRDQWLHGCWLPEGALVHLEAAFAAGERSIHGAVAGLVVHRYGPDDPAALADADTVDDLPAGDR